MTTMTPANPSPATRSPRPMRAPVSASTVDPIRVLRRHVWTILGSVVVGGVLGVVAFLGFSRFYSLYTGEVLFELRAGLSDPTEVGVSDISANDLLERLARTQAVLLVSREVLETAMENPAIRGATTWHEKFLLADDTFDLQEAVDELEEDLSTPIIRGTNLFGLRWTTFDKNDIPVVLNSITRAYEAKRKALDDATIGDNMTVFSSRLNETDSALRDINLRIGQFIIERGLTTLDDPRYSAVAQALQELTERITERSSDLSLARTGQFQVEAKLEGTLDPSSEDILNAENDVLIIDRNRLVDAKRTELRAKRAKFNKDSPQVRQVEQEVRAAEAERDSRLEEIVSRNLEAERKTLLSNIEGLGLLIDEMETEAEEKDRLLRELSADHAEYQAMETEREQLEATRQQQAQMTYELTLMRLRADATRVRVAQGAIPPREPSFPQPEILIPLFVLASLGLTVGFVFFRELTDQRVKSPSDLATMPGATVLGCIPDLEDDPTRSKAVELVVREHPNSVLAESFRQAGASISHVIERHGFQTMLFMGGLPDAGTTTTVTNIAACLAAIGKRVVVIDADFRRPRLAKSMGMAADGPGLADLLAEKSSLEEVIQSTDFAVDVIGPGTVSERIIERLNSSQFDVLLAELRGRYDLILFDVPPAIVAGDAMAIANRVDSAVVVVRANRELRGLVARLIARFNESPCTLVGLLLNRPLGTVGGYYKKNYAAMAQYGIGESD